MRLVTYWLQSPVDRLGRAGSCAFKVPLLLVLCAGLSRLSRPTLTFRPAAVWGGVEREGNLLLRPASARRNCPAPMTHPRAYITLSPLSGVFGTARASRNPVSLPVLSATVPARSPSLRLTLVVRVFRDALL